MKQKTTGLAARVEEWLGWQLLLRTWLKLNAHMSPSKGPPGRNGDAAI